MTKQDQDTQQPELETVADSISQVGRTKSKSLSTPALVIGGAILVAVLVIMFSEEEEKKKDVNFTGEAYEVRQSKAPQKPEPPPKPTPTPAEKQLIIPDMPPVLSQQEIDKKRQEEDLRQRRRRAPVVLINNNAVSPNKDNRKDHIQDDDAININSTEANRKMELLENTTKAALEARNGGASQVDKPIAASELKSAHVVTNYATNLEQKFKIAQGKVIPGILETAIQTDLSGMIRAKVSEDVFSEDGDMLLILKGSRLIGEYKSGIAEGQVRVFVIWTRLKRPDGVDIKLDAPGVDAIGRSGMAGWVDTHFVERFGAAAMMSVISGFAQHGSNNQSQQQALSNSFAKSSEVILNKSINIPPTIGVDQGSRINVFVAKDLDFKTAILKSGQKDQL